MDHHRRRTLQGLALTPALALGLRAPAHAAGTPARPASPPDFGNAPGQDLRGWAVGRSTAVDARTRSAFALRKAQTAYTHSAANTEQRGRTLQQFASRLQIAPANVLDRPTPGGVGYGMFYTDAFKARWDAGTAIQCDYICPAPPGGNVDTFLYLTATNRSAFGVEAFILYYGQDEPRFMVFDWAQAATNPWQLSLPFAGLDGYFQPAKSGDALNTLSVWNNTYRLGARFYRNEVLLYHHGRHAWDLVYQFDYAADDGSQKADWIGSWGPIVETFQTLYTDTRPMGVRQTLLASADAFGRWEPWAKLRADESTVRNDNLGFQARNIAPNFSFVAIS